jgi:hypothetical protein
VVGHVDWEAHNMAWDGDVPVAVWDWDSVAAPPEVGVVGAAATVYPSSVDGTVVAATMAQTEQFLGAYIQARGRRWSEHELCAMWGYGLWVLSYNAKKEVYGGGTGYLAHLEREGSLRLNRAGGAEG